MPSSLPPPQSLAASLNTMRVLWLALFVSSALFVVAAAFSQVAGDPTPLPLPFMAVFAAALFVASFVVPPMLAKKTFAEAKFAVSEEAAETEGGFRSSPGKIRVLSDPNAAMRTFLPGYQTSMILGLALAEAVCMCGLVVAISSHVWWQSVPFAIASWIAMLPKFPAKPRLVAGLERVANAKYREEPTPLTTG